MERTRPTGMPRGNIPPCPDETSTSPTWICAPSRDMYLNRSTPLGSPSTMPGARVRRTWAPTVEAGSVRTWTMDTPGRTSTTRPTSSAGEITAVWREKLSPPPRFTVSARIQPPQSRARISPEPEMGGRRSWGSSQGGDRHLFQKFELIEHLAHAERDARERVFTLRDGQVRLLAQQVVDAAEQRPPARDHDALVHDIGRELRRGPLQARADCLDNRHDGLAQRLADLLVRDHDGLRDAIDEVAPLDLHGAPVAAHRIGGAERHLDLLGPPLAHEQVVVLADVLDDRLVHLVAGDAHRLRVDDARERDHGDL